MQVAVSTVSNLERRIEISVPAAQVSSEFENRLKQVARNARLKGFRPGKAPMPVVRQQYGDQVRSELLGDLFRQSPRHLAEQRAHFSLLINQHPPRIIVTAQMPLTAGHLLFTSSGSSQTLRVATIAAEQLIPTITL